MTGPDIRWQQRFANFRKALAQLTVHPYSESAAKEIALAIRSTYYPLFRSLEQSLAACEKDPEQ